MKATISRDEFRDAAIWAARHAAPSSATPVLQGVLIAVNGEKLTLTAGDYDTWAAARVAATVHSADPDRVVVAGKLLGDTAAKLPDADVELVAEGDELTLTCGPMTLTARTMPAVDYPTVPGLPAELGRIDAEILAPAVARVAVAAAKEDSLPVARGVLVRGAGGNLQLDATDRYRLARTAVTWTPAARDGDGQALVPASALIDLAKAASGVVRLHLDEHEPTSIGMSWPGRQVLTRLIDGAPIAYDRVMTMHEPAIEFQLDRTALLDALGRVAVVYEGGKNVPRLHLNLDAGQLDISVRTSARGRAQDAVPVVYDGPSREIQCNATYLTEAVKAVGGDVLRIGLTPDRLNSAVLTSDVDPNHRHLVMLLRDGTE